MLKRRSHPGQSHGIANFSRSSSEKPPRSSHSRITAWPLLAIALLLQTSGLLLPPAGCIAQCQPADPDSLGNPGAPLFALDWGFNIPTEATSLINARASIYTDDPNGLDYRQISRPPSLLYYNLTSQPYSYWLTYYNVITATESAFYHSHDPASLSASSTASGVELHWMPDMRFVPIGSLNNSPTNPISIYVVYRSTNNVDFSPIGYVSSGTSYVDPDSSLVLNTTYYYKVVSLYMTAPIAYSLSCQVLYAGELSSPRFWLSSHTYAEPLADQDSTYVINIRFDYSGTFDEADIVALQWKTGSGDSIQLINRTSSYVWGAISRSGEALRNTGGIAYRLLFIESGDTTRYPKRLGGDRGYYMTNINNRLRSRNYPTYLMRPDSPEWQDILASVTADSVGAGVAKHDGLFGDNAFPQLPGWHRIVRPLEPDSTDVFVPAISNMLKGIKAAGPANMPLYINGLVWPYYTLRDSSNDLIIQGATQEGLTWRATWPLLAGPWRAVLKTIITYAQSFDEQRTILFATTPHDHREYQMLDLVGYYLAKEDNEQAPDAQSLFGHGMKGSSFGFYPEQLIDLGSALTSIAPSAIPEPPAEAFEFLYDPEKEIDCSSRTWVRVFEKGIVIADCADPACSSEPVLLSSYDSRIGAAYDTIYHVRVDDKLLLEGGRIWTEPVEVTSATTIQTTGGNGYIYLFEPLQSPEAYEQCVYAAYADGSTPLRVAVQSDHALPLWVELSDTSDTSPIFTGTLVLHDNGQDGDELACDGIYTATAGTLPTNFPLGVRSLRIFMQDTQGIASYGYVTLLVRSAPSVVRYEDRSGETALRYEGTPYSSITFDYSGDGRKDMFISIKNDNGVLYRQQDFLSEHNMPVFDVRTDYDFEGGSAPQAGLRGLAYADYDNDGDIDFFAAAESNARLYCNMDPDSTHADRYFADNVEETNMDGWVDHSWSGSWGDYDRDGRVDLLVCRGIQAGQNPNPAEMDTACTRLLRNQGTTFMDLATYVHIYAGSATGSVSSSWADVDGDNDLDLFVGELRSDNGVNTSRLYINNDNGFFTEDYANRFPELTPEISGVTWADYDNDGDLDLSLASQTKNPQLFINDGTGHFTNAGATTMNIGAKPSIGLMAFDHDLDSKVDALVLPDSSLYHPWMMANISAGGGPVFDDQSAIVNLASSLGRVDGAVVADYNGDGDEDIYLGRLIPQGEDTYFYRSVQSTGAEAPVNDWVGIRLQAGGGNNRAAIGAKVKLLVGAGYQQVRQIDGGSSRGGQADNTLIFGLGDIQGTVQAVVKWPGGYQQTVTVDRNEITTIVDDTTPGIVAGSVSSSYVAKANRKADWIFTWETQYSCDPALDSVTITDGTNPPQCEPLGSVTLQPGMPGVDHTCVRKPGGGYTHTLKWLNMNCYAICEYNYYVHSETDSQHQSTSQTKQIRIRVCIN